MFQDPPSNFQGSPTSSLREPATQFPNLVVFPPELDNPTEIKQTPLEWLEALSYDDSKILMADHGGRCGLSFSCYAHSLMVLW